MVRDTDFLIIGAGIAGVALAANLAPFAGVILLDRESGPMAYSADHPPTIFTGLYGNAPVRALAAASYPFFDNPPEGFVAESLWRQRRLVMIARDDQLDTLRRHHHQAAAHARGLRWADAAEVFAYAPMLRPGYASAGLIEDEASDLDVRAFYTGCLGIAQLYGARIVWDAEVTAIQCERHRKLVSTRAGAFSARAVVNAAGASAGEVAALAGARPIGLRHGVRSAFSFAPRCSATWGPQPSIVDVSRRFHLKPEGDRFLGSSGDVMLPPDAQSRIMADDDVDVMKTISAAVSFGHETVERRRPTVQSFASDETPIVGYDAGVDGLFWLAALGGGGVMMAPAVGRAAATLLLYEPFPADLVALGIGAATLSPRRLRPLRVVAGQDADGTRGVSP